MTSNKSYLTKAENAKNTRAWLSIWIQLRHYCEIQWDCFCQEKQKNVKRGVSRLTPPSVAVWCRTLTKVSGRRMPAIVGAAATFRRDFVKLVAAALPELGVELPRACDPTDKAIANSPDWETAIKVALSNVEEVKELIRKARPKWGVTIDTSPKVILDRVQKAYEHRLRQLILKVKPKLLDYSLNPLTESDYILVPANPINEAIVEAIMPGAMKSISDDEVKSMGLGTSFGRGHKFDTGRRKANEGRAKGLIGFKQPVQENLWKFLEKNSALAIKANYALWARWSQSFGFADVTPMMYLSLSLSQFCDDLGFIRFRGDHRLESKKAAVSTLELLTEIEIVCHYRSSNGLREMISGPIWVRGELGEDMRGFENIFKKEVNIRNPLWINKVFSYAPGALVDSEMWQRYNQFTARLAGGFFKINTQKVDKYSVIVGGYLTNQVRIASSDSIKVKVRTLVEKSGLLKIDGKKNPERMEDKLYDALEGLVTAGVIKAWTKPTNNDRSKEYPRWVKNWLGRSITIALPKLPE